MFDSLLSSPVVGGVAGSLLSYFGARSNAREQMSFQRDMSNTAYQRAAKDLEAAGLNRVLALGNPASTPAGAQGAVPDFGDTVTRGYSAKSQADVNKQQVELLAAQKQKALTETELTEMQKELVLPQVNATRAAASKNFMDAALTEQAVKNSQLDFGLKTLELDKQQVLKQLYKVGAPLAEGLGNWLGQKLSNSTDAAQNIGFGATKAQSEFISNSRDARDTETSNRFGVVLAAQDYLKMVREGKMKPEDILNKDVRDYVMKRLNSKE